MKVKIIKQKKALSMQLKDNLSSYMFLVPWLLGFFLLVIYPVLYSLYISFTRYNLIAPPVWIGFQNYFVMLIGNAEFPRDQRFLKSLLVTLNFVFTAVPGKLVFALAVAMIMNQKLRMIPFYRTVYYIPTLLGGSVAISVLWRQLFSTDGVINVLIRAVSQGSLDPPSWISTPEYALYTLVILAIWQFGSPMIIFLAALKQVPQEFYEAASVDGAGKVRQFFSITLPCISPIIFFNLIMQMISAFQSFTQSYIISGGTGGPIDSTMFYSLYLYLRGFQYFQMGYASAMAWILLVIIAFFTFLTFKLSGSLVSYGSGE
jgi:multiple sugar transport system permease protein